MLCAKLRVDSRLLHTWWRVFKTARRHRKDDADETFFRILNSKWHSSASDIDSNAEINLDLLNLRNNNNKRKKSDPKYYMSNEFGNDKLEVIFPFKRTPSGNLKIIPDQLVFESKKVSILAADPSNTKIKCRKNLEQNRLISSRKDPRCNKKMEGDRYFLPMPSEPPVYYASSSLADDNLDFEISENTNDVLKPELKLERLGINNSTPFDWNNIVIHEKTNLYEELHRRINNYINADCIVLIGNEEFSCHLLVLQSYSSFFDKKNVKKVELPEKEVSPKAFATIYDWMISNVEEGHRLLRRDNVLELFQAAKYLGVKELEEQCWMFIDSEEVFMEDTAFLLYLEAKNKENVDVMELMIPRIQKFFLMLVSSQDFLDLSISELATIMSSNYICVNNETEVLMSAIRWLKHDWQNRKKDLVQLMKCVRFGHIAPWQLIDIKRNPENPEFVEVMNDPDVLRMTDDGLAFVIVKYWYGHKTSEYYHWIDLLGLVEAQDRNWTGVDVNYGTYKEFLEYLNSYRNNTMIEKTFPKAKKYASPNALDQKYVMESTSTSKMKKEPIPTMDEMLATRKLRPSYKAGGDSQQKFKPLVTMAGRNMEEERESTIKSFSDVLTASTYNIVNCRKDLPPKKRTPNEKTSKEISNSPNERCSNSDQSCQMTENPKKERNILAMFNGSIKKSPSKISHLGTFSVGSKNYTTDKSLYYADRESVLVFGGVNPHMQYGIGQNTGKDMYRYVPDSNCWEFVGELPEPRHYHSVAFLKGRVYLVGGADPRDDNSKGKSVVVSTVWSFEPVNKSWFSESCLIIPRKNFGLVVNHMCLYAIGGEDKEGRVLSSVERYDPLVGVWTEVAPLRKARMGVACTKYRDYIWVAGGRTGSKKFPLLNDIECYDTRRDIWTHIVDLRFPRCFGSMFTMNDRLYLIGGAGRLTDKDRTSSVGAIDVWDSKAREWRLLTELAIPRHGHALAYLGTQILILGGVTTVYMRALSNVECYCCERGTWVRGIAGLPAALSGHGAVTLPPASLM